jgi:hypothetical protein
VNDDGQAIGKAVDEPAVKEIVRLQGGDGQIPKAK